MQHFMRGAAFVLASAALASWPATAQSSAGTFHDQNQRAFALSSFHGTPVVLTFVAAHCVDTCPLINAQFQDVQRRIKATHLHIHLVTLSLDPRHDRPADMRQIARTFNADARYWSVGTANEAVESTLMHRFGVVAQRGARDYDDIHTTYIYLLDTKGRLVKTMLASSNLPADLFAELERSWTKLSG